MPDKKLNEIIERILQVIIPDKIILFGSRARNTAKQDSDYDLMIIKSDIESEWKLEAKIYRNFIGLNVPVDVIVATPEKIEQHKDSSGYIYKQVLKDGIIVYG